MPSIVNDDPCWLDPKDPSPANADPRRVKVGSATGGGGLLPGTPPTHKKADSSAATLTPAIGSLVYPPHSDPTAPCAKTSSSGPRWRSYLRHRPTERVNSGWRTCQPLAVNTGR